MSPETFRYYGTLPGACKVCAALRKDAESATLKLSRTFGRAAALTEDSEAFWNASRAHSDAQLDATIADLLLQKHCDTHHGGALDAD